jgi:hypothetical protein
MLAGALVVAGPQAEAWYRLAPTEAFAVPLSLWGTVLVTSRKPIGTLVGLLLVVLAALTKESFVPFGILAVAWAWFLGARRPAVIGFASLTCVGAIIVARHAQVPDVYALSRDPLSVAGSSLWLLRTTAVATGWPVALIVAYVYRGAATVAALALLATIAFLPQAYLTAGVHVGRYLLPAILVAAFIVALGLARPTGMSRTPTGLSWALRALAAMIVVALAARAGLGARDSAAAWAARNVQFSESVRLLHSELAAHPGAVLIVRPRGPQDYEAALSIRRFVPEGTALLDVPPPQATDDPLSRRLWTQLQAWSTSGGDGYEPTGLHGECVSADLGAGRSDPICLVSVPVRGLD